MISSRFLQATLATLLLFAGAGALGAQFTLSTNLAGNTTTSTGVMMFDITTQGNAVTISRFDHKHNQAGAITVNVYYKVGTWSGFHTNAAAWTLHDTINTTNATAGGFADVTLNIPLVIPASSTYGIAIGATTGSSNYNGTVNTSGYSDANMTILAGAVSTGPFTGGIIGREWSGTVYYNVGGNPQPTLSPATGSGFNSSRVFRGFPGTALSMADLVANDFNDPNIDVTVTAINAAPGVTAPGNQVGVAVPHTLSWTGTPTNVGSYVYEVELDDGVSQPVYTVTLDIVPPSVLLGNTTSVTNTIPFNQTSVRYQTAYSASEIGLPAGTAIYEIRVAGNLTTGAEYQNLRLRMAHTTLATNALGTTFDNNYAGTLETVLGPVTMTPNFISASGTANWYIFPLATPFIYNGTDGILVDWSYDARVNTGFGVGTAAPSGESPRSRVYTLGGNHTTVTATTSSTTTGNYGIHMLCLTPNSVALLGTGVGGGIAAPQNDLVVLNLDGAAVSQSRDLFSMTISKSGSVTDGAIAQVRLIQDNNRDGVVDGGDTVLDSDTFSSGQVTFSGVPLVTLPDISAGQSVRLLVTVSFTSTLATGADLELSIASASDLTLSGGQDLTAYPVASGTFVQRMSGLYTINQTSGDFTDIGDAFDALETVGLSGPVILEVTDSATYVSDPSYSLGINSETAPASQALAPVAGASATNTITLRAASGQTPRVQGNASGAVLFKYTSTTAQTGRGGLVINQSFVIVEGIEVFGGPHFGIITQGNPTTGVGLAPTNITIRRCRVYDVPNGPGIAFMGMNSGWATNYLVEHNFVYNCITAGLTSTPTLQATTNGCIVVRNPDNSPSGAIVRHNTVVHTSTVANTGGIYISNSSGARAMQDISNNIVISSSSAIPAIYLSSTVHAPVTADFNYWFATTHCNQSTLATFALWQGAGYDSNGSNADPILMSATAPYDLRLAPNSPCIDPTGQTSTATIDFFGTTRPQGTAVDIGAHEANWVASLMVMADSAGPTDVTTALPQDQWVGTFDAMSVLSIQSVNSVTFTHVGTTGNASFTNLKLWVDNNADNQFDVNDVQLGSTVASLTGNTVTFSGSPLGAFTAQNQRLTFFLTAQIAAGATLGTARFEINSASDVSATPGSVVGTFPVQGRSIDVINPAPTLSPATGSGFNASRVYNALLNNALVAADLVAEDSNDPNVAISIVAISAAPGVTAPSNQPSAAVPATISWTGTPTAVGSYTYEVTVNDGTNAPVFTVTINVTNPPPTLVPGTGSGFNASRNYSAMTGVSLSSAILVADDANDPTVDITVVAVSAAPGVTAPSSQLAATVPFNLEWTGTPTTVGIYEYTVTLNDGASSPSFTVQIFVTNPAPTLTPASGSAFNASRQYFGSTNIALNAAVLEVDDQNNTSVDVSIVAITAAPGVTAPSNLVGATPPANITWTGTPTATGVFEYEVTVNDGTNAPTFTVQLIISNPAPTLVPATVSGFNAARTYNGLRGTALANGDLVADDTNNTTVDITITSSNPVPGVTAPTNQVAVAVPFTLSWTGTPTAHGTFTYDVQVSDGTNSPSFTVTFVIAHPPLNGLYTIAQSGTPDFANLGEAFDLLESVGLTGPVTLEFSDSATYSADVSYTLGINDTGTVAAVSGVSSTNTITIRAATGQAPKIQGSATGARLQSPLTGRGCLGIMSSYVTVEGLECFDGPNFGIMIQGNSTTLNPTNNVIRRCLVRDIPDGPGIAYMGQNGAYFTDGIIEHNFVYNCFTNSGNPTSSSVLLLNTGGAITVRNPASGSGIVRHNTIVHTSTFNTTSAIYTYSSSSSFAMHDVNNNIIVCTNSTTPAFISQTTTTNLPNPANCNHNYWFANTHCNQATVSTFALWQGTGRDTNGSNANPQLVSTSSPFDLRLADNSPCIDPATQTSTATIDFLGNTRPAGRAVDIGAHEAQVPEIELLQNTTVIANNGTFNAGNVPTTTGTTFQFTIENNGVADLLLNGTTTIAVTLNSNLDVTSGVTSAPASTTVSASGSVTFDILVDPTIDLAFSMTVTIANNDFDRDPYVFNIDGVGFTPNGAAVATITTGSSFSGGANGPFTMAVDPGATLANADLEVTDPEFDNVTVTNIVPPAILPIGITANIAAGPGHPLAFGWTGTADATNDAGDYTWQITFEDAVSGTPVTIDVTITINDLAPVHVISGATGGNGSAGNPYTATWTQTMGPASDIDLASVSDPNTSQVLNLGTIVPGASNPSGGSGFTIMLAGSLLNVAPTAALTANDVGTHTFDVPVTDGTNVTTIAISLTVNEVPVILTPSPLTDGEQGLNYTTLQFTASGGTPALSWTVTGGNVPPGMSLATNGQFSGTPTLQGVYNFTVTVTDGLGVTDSDAFDITIDPPANGNPTITTTSLTGGIVGQTYGPVTVQAAGGTPGYTFSVSSGTLPPGLTMSTAGVISGTPSMQGTFPFDITVQDAAFATDTDTFTITIASTPGGGGGGSSGGGGGGGCSSESGSTYLLALVGLMGFLFVVYRRRQLA